MQALQLGLAMSALIEMLSRGRDTRLTPGLAQAHKCFH
jgi:hypothetical protein